MLDRTEDFKNSTIGAADPADVASPEAAVTALYEAISGPRDTERDWERLRSLFDSQVRFLICRWRTDQGQAKDVVYEWDLEGFISEGRQHWLEHGFWEAELSARVEKYGNMAHVFSSYESRVGSEESEPVARGINSVQLLHHHGRWWITNIVWDIETPENPIPAELGGSDD